MTYPDYLLGLVLVLGAGVILATRLKEIFNTPARRLMRQIKHEQKMYLSGHLSANDIRARHGFGPLGEIGDRRLPQPFKARHPNASENN